MTLARTLAWLFADTAAAWPVADGSLPVTDLALSDRDVHAGALFLACAGSAHHGLEFAACAVAAGAAAVAWEPAPGVDAPRLDVPSLAVPHLHLLVGELAARFFDHPSKALGVIGITGTDGKTSTAHLLAQALESLHRPCLYIGTLGSGRVDALRAGLNTTPDALSIQRELAGAVAAGWHDCAMEVSSIALDQGRVNGVQFAATVLTNIGRDHLDYHHSVANYIAAKRKLFGRGDGAVAVLNVDDAQGRAFAAELADACPVATYGLDPACGSALGYRAERIVTHAQGLRFDIECVAAGQPKVVARVDSALVGRFNVYNLLAAAAVLVERGIPLERACRALSAARTVPGRAEVFHGPASPATVVVDYAHTPQALRHVLAALREHTTGKLVCVFGCGGDRDRGKRPLMGAVAAALADRCVVTDDNPRSEPPAAVVAEICAGMPAGAAVEVCEDRARAIRMAVAQARAGDVVLVAGKGHEDYQIYGTERRPFSDRALAAELVGRELAA
ncbi:MAG TPA: UDP-N-acetylmuramoyl-L-alanyl-D-glutamate--2,6-diaminopimelate ligase [Nevskiaceae bacterium]|nr:UDP-N-acetylmuramoyl-L-alanyl-D-glutamate--2,6-diaminopimelate ligase [Nevskiaceae bacterium]